MRACACRGKEEALALAVMLWREGFVYMCEDKQVPVKQHSLMKGGHTGSKKGGILQGVQHSKVCRFVSVSSLCSAVLLPF